MSNSQKYFTEKNLSIVAAPFSGGQPKRGTENAPSVIIASEGLLSSCQSLGWENYQVDSISIEKQSDDLDRYKHIKNPVLVSQVNKSLAEKVYDHARLNNFIMTLGGDHSIAIGSISGLLKHYGDNLGVIWVDAHADINTIDTTMTGNLHGCPVSFLTRINPRNGVIDKAFEWMNEYPNMRTTKIVYIGLRDVDQEEQVIFDQLSMKFYDMNSVKELGIKKIMDEAIEYLGNDIPLHISFDVDGMDPKYAPATGTPVKDGLTLDEGTYICQRARETGRLVSADFVEVNPNLAQRKEDIDITIQSTSQLMRSCLGEDFPVDLNSRKNFC